MKKQFKAEAKKVMDLMINSIYTEKDIFLRELISNASDAIDKAYYEDLKSENETKKENYYIELIPNKDDRTLTIKDTGIGMDEKDLSENLGTIAKSGTELFKKNVNDERLDELIGQFGVGFYSSFMVADKIVVNSKKIGSDKAYKWVSENADGFEIAESDKEDFGTEITLYLKKSGEDYDYDKFTDPYYLKRLVKQYSNYIRYPIKMLMTKSRKVEGKEDEYEDYKEYEVLNSNLPIWKRNKKELTDEDYINFYRDENFGFDSPLSWLNISLEGMVSFKAIIYIPEKAPFDFYAKDYQKGLELISHDVKIQDRCEELVSNEFSFVKGIVVSDDISLNISRESLQRDRQVIFIAKQINNKIRAHLYDMMKDDREKYEKFFNEFGNVIKMSIYESYGSNKDELEDLLIFRTRNSDKPVSLKEFRENMKSTEENILYAVGDSYEKVKDSALLKTVDSDRDVLILTDRVDEFLIRILKSYDEIEFKSISQVDEDKEKNEENPEKEKILTDIKEILPDDVVEVKFSDKLGDMASLIKQKGDISIEMEKNLKDGPTPIKAQKVLEINKDHKAYEILQKAKEDNNEEEFKEIVKVLYDQAKLVEGLEIDDPYEFAKNIWKLN